jgi:hypothetical protein
MPFVRHAVDVIQCRFAVTVLLVSRKATDVLFVEDVKKLRRV